MRAEYNFNYSKAERGRYYKRSLRLADDAAGAESLRLRTEMMIRIQQFCRETSMTEAEKARLLHLTRHNLQALLTGRLSRFSLDQLVQIATRAGLKIRLVVKNAA